MHTPGSWSMRISVLSFLMTATTCLFGQQTSELHESTEKLAQKSPELAKHKAACEAGGGTFFIEGLANNEVCDHRSADAGKACTDSSECSVRCIAKETKSGYENHGTCDAWRHSIGRCIALVARGQVKRAVYIDEGRKYVVEVGAPGKHSVLEKKDGVRQGEPMNYLILLGHLKIEFSACLKGCENCSCPQ